MILLKKRLTGSLLYRQVEKGRLKLITVEGLSKEEEGVAYKKRMTKCFVFFGVGLFTGASFSSIIL